MKDKEEKVLPSSDKRVGAFAPSDLHDKVSSAIEQTLIASGVDPKKVKIIHQESATQTTVLKKLTLLFEARAKTQDMRPETKKFSRAQLEFFIGASAALEAVSEGAMSLPSMFFVALSVGRRAKDLLHVSDEEVETFLKSDGNQK